MKCEKCNIMHDGSFGSGRFCSRKCSNSRIKTPEIKYKTSMSLIGHKNTPTTIYNKVCVICNNSFEVTGTFKLRQTCSADCLKEKRRQTASLRGRNSALKQNRRSKNEINFANHCLNKFSNVLLNSKMFNGWDADIILPDLKIAILWNGPWHYHKITEKHSLEQVQNRDRIKLKAIRDFGYTEYIIKDMGPENPDFVSDEFKKFLRWIS